MKKIKILYVLSYISRNGGVQSVVNNYYNELSKNKNIQIDFLTLLPGDNEMEEEWRKKGAKIYNIKGSEEKNLFLFLKEIKSFFKEHHDYDIIHSHQTNLDFFYLLEAKKWKIPVRIMHSHSTNCSINKVRMFITKQLSIYASNCYFACSKEAGKYYFGKKFDINSQNVHVLNNAINIEKYIFNQAIREEVKAKLNISNNIVVIGNVARMDENKNHKFLLELFKVIRDNNKNVKLLLVGSGELEKDLKEYSNKIGIEDNVIFYGVSKEVNKLIQAMDIFILPSKYEGVPLTIIEAATSGIKYYVSDTIDTHLLKNDNEKKFNLNCKLNDIALSIMNDFNYERKNMKELIVNSGFDICTETKKMIEFYYKNIELGVNKCLK